MEVTGQGNGTAQPLGALPQGAFETEPEDLEAIFDAFRRYTRPSNVLSLAAAEKIVMRTSRYKDHLDLARKTVRYFQRRRWLLNRRAGGVVWNDPERPLTAAQIRELETAPRISAKSASPLPDAETCRAFLLSLGRDASGAVRGKLAQLARRLELKFQLSSSVTFDLVNDLIDQGVLDLDSTSSGTYRVLSVGETVEAAEVTKVSMAATVVEAASASEEAVTAEPQMGREERSLNTEKPRKVRITPREEQFLVHLMGLQQVTSFYTLARTRLGDVGAAQRFHRLVVGQLGLLTTVIKGTRGKPSVHQVRHDVYDRFEFVVDSTLSRIQFEGRDESAPKKRVAKTSKAAKEVAKVAPVIAPYADAASPDAILARVERELQALKSEESEDRAGYEARAKERERRRAKLEAVRAKAKELIELLRGT